MEDRISIRFSVGVEINLFFVRRDEIDFERAEIDMVLVLWLIDLVFVWVVGIELAFGLGPQIAWF